MKKTLIVFCLTLMLCSTCYADFINPKPGDVYLWKSKTFLLFDIPFPVDLLGAIYGELPSFTHADVCVSYDGDLRTSIQGKGVSSSTVESRMNSFIGGIQLRKETLLEDTVDKVCNMAHELSGDYDYGGYNGQGLDFLIRVPYTPRGYLFTSMLQDPDLYYCSEFVVECFLGAGEMGEVRIHPAPNDIYYIVGSEWKVVGTYGTSEEE